jgi:hypothetical protein
MKALPRHWNNFGGHAAGGSRRWSTTCFAGLRHAQARSARRSQFRTQSVDLGRARTSSIDSVGDILAIAEDEAFK